MKGESVSENDQDVHKKFDIAVQLVKSLPQSASFSPSYAEATKIYSYFKQSKFGVCSIPRPGFWDVVNRAKWDAWSALGDMPPQVAMKNYVEEIKKVYYRIKDIDEFEVKHTEFADVLIPFCQITGTQMTSKLMEIVKENQIKDKPIQMNGTGCVNGISQSDKDDDNDIKNNDIITSNGIENESSPSSCNDDVLTAALTATDVCKMSKTVKFQISDENENENDNHDDEDGQICGGKDNKDNNILVNDHGQHGDSFLQVEIEESAAYEKEEGELSSSGNDSDDEEIYCDSLDPDQILNASKHDEEEYSSEPLPTVKQEPIPVVTTEPIPVITTEPIPVVTTEPLLFSPIPSTTTFQDTTAQNILTKSAEHSHSSSNNSRSDFELVDMARDEKKSFQSVRKRDTPTSLSPCISELKKPLDKKRPKRTTTLIKNEPSEKCIVLGVSEQACHSCVRTHKKPSHHSSVRQSHSGHRNDNEEQGKDGNANSENGASNSNHDSGYHHNRHHHHNNGHSRRSTWAGSNNGGSGDDSCTSLSSSSSDNVGLKIVKALERMDDNMHLILNRLDSIDSSMKILAVQPQQPWWVSHIPSRFVILSTLWPFIVNLIFYYFWRRRRRRLRRRLENIPTNCNET